MCIFYLKAWGSHFNMTKTIQLKKTKKNPVKLLLFCPLLAKPLVERLFSLWDSRVKERKLERIQRRAVEGINGL